MRSQFAEYIKAPKTQKAFRRLLKLVDKSKLTCKCKGKSGNKRWCNFYDDDKNIPYAFIVNRRSLLFYFRKCALTRPGRKKTKIKTHQKKLAKKLRRDFGKGFNKNPNQRTEYHVRLRCVRDVKRLEKHLVW